MMTTRPLRLVFVLLAAVLLAPVGARADRPHGKPEHRPEDLAGLVIFGDSLSDTGNKFIVTGLVNRPPYDLLDEFIIPDGPYARGGLNHSNGALWIEQLARPLEWPRA